MVNVCCVDGCPNRSTRDKAVSFYSIPKVLTHQGHYTQILSEERRKMWVLNINRRAWEPVKSSRVCSVHFIGGKPSLLHDATHPDWAPTQAMGHELRPSSYKVPASPKEVNEKVFMHKPKPQKRKADNAQQNDINGDDAPKLCKRTEGGSSFEQYELSNGITDGIYKQYYEPFSPSEQERKALDMLLFEQSNCGPKDRKMDNLHVNAASALLQLQHDVQPPQPAPPSAISEGQCRTSSVPHEKSTGVRCKTKNGIDCQTQTDVTTCDLTGLEERIRQLERGLIELRSIVNELQNQSCETSGLQKKDPKYKLYKVLPRRDKQNVSPNSSSYLVPC